MHQARGNCTTYKYYLIHANLMKFCDSKILLKTKREKGLHSSSTQRNMTNYTQILLRKVCLWCSVVCLLDKTRNFNLWNAWCISPVCSQATPVHTDVRTFQNNGSSLRYQHNLSTKQRLLKRADALTGVGGR